MGLFKKLIDILSDDIEEEVEVKEQPVIKQEQTPRVEVRETPQVEQKFVNTGIYDATKDRDLLERQNPVQAQPNVQPTVQQSVQDRSAYQKQDTFKFPVFNDKDIEKTMSRSRSVMEPSRPTQRMVMPEQPVRREEPRMTATSPVMAPTPAPEKKSFRPSPVISPIYGVLDKNYKKEEIVERKEEIEKSIPRNELSYDTVRRKAYGTLEDDLEDTLMSINKSTLKEVEEIERELDSLENPKKHIEQLLEDLEKTASMTVGELEEALKNEMEDTVEIKESVRIISEFDDELPEPIDEPKRRIEEDFEFTEEFKPRNKRTEKVDEQKLENDLFNLIDSMYEEGDE